MSEGLPDGPFLVPPYKPASGGVDFLGLRQVNLDMMSRCLPGINNVTFHIRPYSVLSWIHWKFYQLAHERGLNRASQSVYQSFLEKVETLFTWGHQLQATRGVPGVQSKTPPARNGRVPLAFEAWGRAPDNTSLMAAVQYGPSSKTTGGLSFLEPLDGGFFRVRGNGVSLATEMDRRISNRQGAAVVNTLHGGSATEADAAGLFEAWRIDRPSKNERLAFRRSFFAPECAGEDTLTGHRSATLELILVILRNNPGLAEQEIRRSLTYLRSPSGQAVKAPAELVGAHRQWLALQLRQVQRLAFESLLSWVEMRVIDHGDRETDAIALAASQALADSDLEIVSSEKVAALRSRLAPAPHDLESWCARASSNEHFDIFPSLVRLEELHAQPTDDLLAVSLRGLFLTAGAAEVLALDSTGESLIRLGGPERVSLRYWTETLERCDGMSARSFLVYVLENLILSQHFAVAAGRFDGVVQRLRLSIEEDGLTCLVPKPWHPTVTLDRLATALSLSSECGLINFSAEDQSYTLGAAASE